MNNRFIKRTLFVLPALLLLLAGCETEDEDGRSLGADPAVGLAVRISVPEMRTPVSRALDAAKEKEVDEVNMLIFSSADNTLLEHYHITGGAIAPAGGVNDYTISLGSVENPSGVTIAVIANAGVETARALAAVSGAGNWKGAAKADFLEALQFGSALRWQTSASDYWTIPMYGEAVVSSSTTIYDGVPTVALTRMLAKVDVANNVAPDETPSPGTFELTAVHIVNYNIVGFIAPTWNTDGVISGAPSATPNLPVDPGTQTWASGKQLTYTLGSGATGLTNEIYVFEAAAMAEDVSAPTGLRLVLEGNYTDADGTGHYYYPADFTTPAAKFMPVLRNNRYLFTIVEASGRGYDRLSEAVLAFGVVSNLRTSLMVVDESGIKDIVWNGEYFLGTGDPAIISGEEGSTGSIPVTTNYEGGWQIDTRVGGGTGIVYSGSGSGWLTLEKDGTSDALSANITITATENQGSGERTAIIHLKAGRLTHSVAVRQREKPEITSRFAKSNIVMYVKDGQKILTFAETEADYAGKTVGTVNVPGIAPNVQGLHFRWGSLLGITSNGATSEAFADGITGVAPSAVVFWPMGYTALPTSRWTFDGASAGVVEVPYITSAEVPENPLVAPDCYGYDAFLNYPNGTGKGFDIASGKGDICRYITEMGWVKAKWRMPTTAEMEELYAGNRQAVGSWAGVSITDTGVDGKYGYFQLPTAYIVGPDVTTGSTIANPGTVSLIMPTGGQRNSVNGGLYHPGNRGLYWSSTPATEENAYYLLYHSLGIFENNTYLRGYGYSIRCIRVGDNE